MLGPRHQRVQRLRRLIGQRSVRQLDRAFVVEGAKLIDVALAARAGLEALYYAPEAESSPSAMATIARAEAAGVRTFGLSAGVMEKIADTVTPQPVLAVVSFLDREEGELGACASVLVLVEVRDPGNVGAIIRSADAAGIGAVVCCENSADLFNPKTVRASAGSIFHLPLVRAGAPEAVLDRLSAAGFWRIGAVAHGGVDYGALSRLDKVAIVFGNEAKGIPESLSSHFDELVTIPTAGGAESLNVAMAATILCFELTRRRRVRAGSEGLARTL